MNSKNEKEKLEQEINYWKIHLESIDKTNIEIIHAKSMMLFNLIIVVLVTIVIGILSVHELGLGSRIVFGILICIIFFFWIRNFLKKYDKKINHHNLSLMIRERMIQERYEKLGISKKELNKEFEDLKEIYKNPKNALKKHLIKEYYKNNKVGKI